MLRCFSVDPSDATFTFRSTQKHKGVKRLICYHWIGGGGGRVVVVVVGQPLAVIRRCFHCPSGVLKLS